MRTYRNAAALTDSESDRLTRKAGAVNKPKEDKQMARQLIALTQTGALMSEFEALYTGRNIVDAHYIESRGAIDVDGDDVPAWCIGIREIIRKPIPKRATIYQYVEDGQFVFFAAL